MKRIPISGLTAASSLDGTEVVPVVQGGVTKKADANTLFDGVRSSFDTIALVAASSRLRDGQYYRAESGYNGEPETFLYDASSTDTADGVTIVEQTALGGRLISTRTWFKTVAELLADPRGALGVGTAREAAGFRYTEAASGAPDQHITTAGGVKLYVVPQNGALNVLAFGAPLYVTGGNPEDAAPFFQKALNAAAASGTNPANGLYRGVVYVPTGRYWFGSSVQIPNYVWLKGAHIEGVILDHQTDTVAYPLFVNQDSDSMNFVRISDMRCVGGTWLLDATVPSNMDNVILENIRSDLQSEGTQQVTGPMYYCRWNNVRSNLTAQGLRQTGGAANHNAIRDSQFTNLSDNHIYLGTSVKQFDVIETRFEGGGLIGGVTVVTNQARQMNFRGCFFENVHKTLISDGNTRDGITFSGNTFVYHNSTGTPEEFDFSSTGIVNFGTNFWEIDHAGADKMFINGDNGGKLGKGKKVWVEKTRNSGRMIGSPITLPTSGTQTSILDFSRTFTSAALTNTAFLTGTLSVGVMSITSGGQRNYVQKDFLVRVASYSSAALVVNATEVSSNDSLVNITGVSVGLVGSATGTTATLGITVTGNAPTDQVAAAHWSFDFATHTTLDELRCDFA